MTRQKTRKRLKIACIVAPIVAVLAVTAWYLHRTSIPVLQPAGEVAQKERNLIIIALLLSVIVVVPVFATTIMIAVKYREGNHEKRNLKYTPDWDHSRLLESIWWGVPTIIIIVLSVITWTSSHELDPYKALASSRKPINVEVIGLNWKWLFIYPDQHIASVNLVEFPKNTPVDFHITSDTIMNSFWIPQLGSQIYAMPGMSTQLHLVADKTGSFYGTPANIAGKGFARMTFTAKSVSQTDFDRWVASAQRDPKRLNTTAYNQLARPFMSNQVTYYSYVKDDLYNGLVMKYMAMPMSNGASNMPKSGDSSQSKGSSGVQGMYMQ